MSDKYSDETRAQVMAALMAGQSIGQVSREYKIPKSTVSRWKNDPVPTDGTQKRDIGELILKYLQANLEALYSQAKVFTDEKWLKKQEASQLAVLHGVMTDKAIRIIEAMDASSGAKE